MSDFDYELPEELIAQEPLADRAGSRLLHLEKGTGRVWHRGFRDCVELLEAGDLLVMNDTRVSAIRLFGEKPTGGSVEALLLREESAGRFVGLAKPGRRLRLGAEVEFEGGLRARVVEEREEGLRVFLFEGLEGWREELGRVGRVPLPPYIRSVLRDKERYQTVIASVPGSAAAPTAGLHFTGEILDCLAKKGVSLARVTLDVGLDTFRPVSGELVWDHEMHGERCVVGAETAAAVRECRGRVVAVGTTSVRTLETMAVGRRMVEPGERVSRLFISPGYEWQVVDGMFTNFHMPRTTMLLMISALAGRESVMGAYGEAVRERYRFLSFGDSMLII